MDIKQQKEILIKAYHECIYQEKSLHRPIFYYKDKIIEIRRKPNLTEEDHEKEWKLERDLRRYERNIGKYYKNLRDMKESIVRRLARINMKLKAQKEMSE